MQPLRIPLLLHTITCRLATEGPAERQTPRECEKGTRQGTGQSGGTHELVIAMGGSMVGMSRPSGAGARAFPGGDRRTAGNPRRRRHGRRTSGPSTDRRCGGQGSGDPGRIRTCDPQIRNRLIGPEFCGLRPLCCVCVASPEKRGFCIGQFGPVIGAGEEVRVNVHGELDARVSKPVLNHLRRQAQAAILAPVDQP
jgi:hypothetical protein